jgi:hypothetical protein
MVVNNLSLKEQIEEREYLGKIHCVRFSFFYDTTKGIRTVKPYKEINFKDLVKIYKSDKLKVLTEKLRATENETEKAELKKQLPFFTPMGTFSPARSLVNLHKFNSEIVCIDIDGLKPHQVQHVKFILEPQQSTLLCARSPRGKGIKALILINERTPKEHCYNTLKLNKNNIAEALGLNEYVSKIDNAQFNPTQPCFISYDEDIYINFQAEYLNIKFIQYKEPIIKRSEPDFLELKQTIENSNYQTPIDYRIRNYFQHATNNLVKFFALCSEGNRHSSIIKVQAIASWIHYAPQIESEIKESLLNACIGMYGTIQNAEANNVIKSFERAWNNAPIKRNETIESIINDLKYKR